MAPPAEDVPDCFEVSRDSAGKAVAFQCTVCKTSWLKRWKGHYLGPQHAKRAADVQERDAAHQRTERAYQEAEAARLNAAPPDLDAGPAPFFDADLDTFRPLPDAPEVSVEEAQAMLDAARTESAEDFQVRMQHAMTELVTKAGWLQLDAETEANEDATLGPTVDADMESLLAAASTLTLSNDWCPYNRKTMTYLHLMLSLPRMRISDAHLAFFLHAMSEVGCRDVPTLYEVRKMQQDMRLLLGAHTVQHVSELGNVFYSNDIRETVALEMQNPQVAEHFMFYPELEADSVREVWQATRWTELPPELLTPMIRLGAHDFFVDEVAQLHDGVFVVPRMWFIKRQQLYGRCIPCVVQVDGTLMVDASAAAVDVIGTQFVRTYIDLCDSSELPRVVYPPGQVYHAAAPNWLRVEANGEAIYSLMLNVSKQYNKHINVCISNMCLPAALLQQEYFVRFFSTSPAASSAEQLAALKEQILATHTAPWPTFNAKTGQRCKFRLVVQALPGDNPQQSDNCSHLGLQANLNCRRCMNTTQVPQDLDGGLDWYLNNFFVSFTLHGRLFTSAPRSKEQTKAAVEKQLRLACRGIAERVATEQTESGVKDSVATFWIDRLIRKAREMKEAYHKNPGDTQIPQNEEEVAKALWRWLESQPGEHWHPLLTWIGIDAHSDTPVELLHTILLGIAKYAWYDLHSDFTPEEQALFVTRLQASDLTGLTLPPLRASYILQYKNNLIGRHFKALLQLQVFHIYGICATERFTLVKAIGSLSAMLWYTEIRDMDVYLADLRILIANVLDAYTAIDPTRILIKAKLHVLPHLPDDIRRYGPAVRFATEIFECFNAIFRMCSVLSNHQAPSRDIALALADIDQVKHIVSGGYWRDPASGEFVRASDNVRNILRDHPIVQSHLGWVSPKPSIPGTVKLPAKTKRIARSLTVAELASLERDHPQLASDVHRAADTTNGWCEAAEVISVSGDICGPRAWVMCGDNPGQSRLARIRHILVATVPQLKLPTLVVVQYYSVADTLHPHFGMPFTLPPNDDESTGVLLPSSVRFIINVQHDCRTAQCGPTGTRAVMQERVETANTVPEIVHTSAERWIINTHAFHNASLLREVLPRELTRPVPLKADRTEFLEERARRAFEEIVEKKKKAAAKAAETRARNKAAAEKAAAAAPEGEDSERPRKRKR